MSESDPAESFKSVIEPTTLGSETGSQTQIKGASNIVVHQAPGSSFVLNQTEDQYLNAPEEEIRLVVIGRTGEGKSSTCNSILTEKHFIGSAGFSSVSKRSNYLKKEIFGYDLSVVDTPGIFDTDDAQFETMFEIVKSLLLSSPGPHAFLLVISVLRYTTEAREAVANLLQFFGMEALSKTIIVFTRIDELSDSGSTLRKALDQAPEDLRSLIEECGGRYVGFNNKANRAENKRQVSELLQKVTELKQKGGFFTSNTYEQVEKVLKKNLRKEASTMRRACTEQLTVLQEVIDKQKQEIEHLESKPMTQQNQAELEQLVTQLNANKRLFEENKMDTIMTDLRKNMKMNIAHIATDIYIGAALGGAAGASFGAFVGFGIGAAIGGPVGAFIGGLANGLSGYFTHRKATTKTRKLIKQMNEEVCEVMRAACQLETDIQL